MDWINRLVLDHVMKEPAVTLALVAAIARVDHLTQAVLKVFTPAQVNAAIDKVDALAKAEVAKVAAEPPKPGA